MNIIRISTAGSVDDGKSTLIGRLLYDTKSITKDKIEHIRSISTTENGIDFSLFTDGLIAEREQGITIDVAHIYFSTERNKYIISDTPGHEQYTRNMITGTSLSDTSIILLDARKGVIEQTKRHFFITQMFNIKNVIVCINKMDLVEYKQETFETITANFKQLFSSFMKEDLKIHFVPTSAVTGENITLGSKNMNWYKGEKMLDILDKMTPIRTETSSPFRMYVQYVLRPKSKEYHDFRGFSGLIQSGSLAVGDEISVLPSKKTSTISEIIKGFEKKTSALAGEAVTICFKDEIDIARGDILVEKKSTPLEKKEHHVIICWMDEEPFNSTKRYILQIVSKKTLVKIHLVESVYSIKILEFEENNKNIIMNTIAKVRLKSADALYFDAFKDVRFNARFILIDEQSNNTVAMGKIIE